MRLRVMLVSLAMSGAGAAVVAAPADARFPLKSCGKVVVRQPAGFSSEHYGGYLYTRGLTCEKAKISVRYAARRLTSSTSLVVRGNTYDCEVGMGGNLRLDCFGIRPGDEEPTVGFLLQKKKRR